MFHYRRNGNLFSSAFTTAELIYHGVVRSVRAKHSNAIVALLQNILQIIVMVSVFYLMMSFLGLRAAKIRGDFVLYLMSGIFLFQCHIKTLGAVAAVASANNPMTLHSPMNMLVMLLSAAFSALYIQIVSMLIILFVYSVGVNPVEIEDPAGAFGMVVLAWFTGAAVGLIFLALTPWFPTTAGILRTIYIRANFLASGKMFVANTLPPFMLALFSWNPLFHIIDQCRGFVFRNYFPRTTNWEYALWVGVVLLMIGLMGEFYTRRHISKSWFARR